MTSTATSTTEGRWLLRLAVGSALAMTVLVAAKLLGVLTPEPPPPPPPEAVAVEEWPELIATEQRIGPTDAKVVVVEFADFECPYCRGYALETLPAARAAFPNDVAVIYRHLPMPYHRFAVPSAVAVECAGRQGRFEAMHDLLYEKQDSIGLLAWDEVARRSGVSDTAAWRACRADQAVRAGVVADGELGRRIGATGTPTVVINGMRYARPLQAGQLERVIGELLDQ